MNLICIGDNVTDCYVDEGICYPGGNCVNVAVNSKRLGIEDVNYIGIFGDDDKSSYIITALEEEGITTHRSRRVHAPAEQPGVKLSNGDRIFVEGPRDTCQHLFAIHLVDEDIDVIKNYELIHTSCYSHVEYELRKMAKIAEVSMDFSDIRDDEYLDDTLPYITYGFFSASDLDDEETEAFLKKVTSYGVKIACVTRGSKGAMVYDGNEFHHESIKQVKAIDTMGAGDSFIAAFLFSYRSGKKIDDSMIFASENAAKKCLEHGAFGHPHKM